MHISEGVLSPSILIVGGVVAFTGTAIGLKKIDHDKIINVSLLTSAFFIASLIHVPIGPGSIHLVLGGLLGVLLGWSCFPAIMVALFLQSIFFQFGGLTVLGVNTTTMALPPLICFYLFRPWFETNGKKRLIASFSCGFFSILLSSILMALALSLTDKGFFRAAQLIIVTQIPLMFIEGLITMFTVSFLAKVQPEFLQIRKS